MEIEEKVFGCRRFIPDALPGYGFVRAEGGYRYESEFLNGEFSAVVFVSDDGAVSGTVIDNMNGEEYRQLRFDNFQGAYVNSVREAYEELLNGISDACCREVLFGTDQANRVAAEILDRFGVAPDYPWGQSPYEKYGVFRHGDNSKWFALIMNVKRSVLLKNGDVSTVDIINLKADPVMIGELTLRPGVFRAYHMSHKCWISVLLDDTLTDGEVMELVNGSFLLTAPKPSARALKQNKAN